MRCGLGADRGRVDADRLEQRGGDAVGLREQRQQQMGGPDLRVAGRSGRLQRGGQRRLGLGGRVERVHDTSRFVRRGQKLVEIYNAANVESVPLKSTKLSGAFDRAFRHLFSRAIRTYDRSVGDLTSIGYNGQPVRAPFRPVRPPLTVLVDLTALFPREPHRTGRYHPHGLQMHKVVEGRRQLLGAVRAGRLVGPGHLRDRLRLQAQGGDTLGAGVDAAAHLGTGEVPVLQPPHGREQTQGHQVADDQHATHRWR